MTAGHITEHFGMCDASAAVALSPLLFIAASDEDNALRVYASYQSGAPIFTYDVSQHLMIPSSSEADIEGSAQLGEIIFWITSHGRNEDGKMKPNRHQLFATRVTVNETQVVVEEVGHSYTRLQGDLIADHRFSQYHLREAAQLPPKEKGGFNIEGLCATPDGHLLIGFRNPIPKSKALVVPLLNACEVLDGMSAQLGDPIELDLGGLGIRSLEYWPDRNFYLIGAGPFDTTRDFKLYRWDGPGCEPILLTGAQLQDLNIEGIVVYPGKSGQFQLLSDDGSRVIQGKACKDLKQAKHRRFRSIWLEYPD